MKVDKIVKNAKVFTSNKELPFATALVVKDGKFAYVGDEAGLANFEGEVCDLDGRFVMPAIIDSHVHVTMGAAFEYTDMGDAHPVLKQGGGDPFPGKWVTLVLKKLETAPIRQRSSTLRKTYEVLAPIIHERSWRPTHIPMAEESGDVRARRCYEEAGHRDIRPGVMQLHLVDGVEQRRVLKKQRWHAGDLVVRRTRRHRLLCG